MTKLARSPDKRIGIVERARDRFVDLIDKNRVELEKMEAAGKSSAFVRQRKLIQAIGELDALLSALPPEVRGRVGGYATLAKIGTGEKALGVFFTKRVGMVEDVLERVFPTRVGMNRKRRSSSPSTPRIPHASGDEPLMLLVLPVSSSYSPREWG